MPKQFASFQAGPRGVCEWIFLGGLECGKMGLLGTAISCKSWLGVLVILELLPKCKRSFDWLMFYEIPVVCAVLYNLVTQDCFFNWFADWPILCRFSCHQILQWYWQRTKDGECSVLRLKSLKEADSQTCIYFYIDAINAFMWTKS